MQIFPLRIFPFFHFHPIFLFVSLFLYFLPTYLARNKSNFAAIFALNLLTGWTFIGWIAALIWAVSSEPKQQGAVPAQPIASVPPLSAAGGSFFCTNCGKPCVAGARFCSSCGAAQPATQR